MAFVRCNVGGMYELVVVFVHSRRTERAFFFFFSSKEMKERKTHSNFIMYMSKENVTAQILSLAGTKLLSLYCKSSIPSG